MPKKFSKIKDYRSYETDEEGNTIKKVDLGNGRTIVEITYNEDDKPNKLTYDEIEPVPLNMEDETTIPQYLDMLLSKNRLSSDREISRYLGVSHATVNKWRLGKAFPSPETMIEIAEATYVPSDVALMHLNYWKSKTKQEKYTYKTMLGILYAARHATYSIVVALSLLVAGPPSTNSEATAPTT